MATEVRAAQRYNTTQRVIMTSFVLTRLAGLRNIARAKSYAWYY